MAGYGAMGLTSYYGGIEKDDDVNRETIKLVSPLLTTSQPVLIEVC